MNDFPFPLVESMAAASAFSAGALLGLSYFGLLMRSVEALVSGGGWRAALGMSLARLAGAGVVLAIAARFGATSLLSVFVGFLAARTLVLRRARKDLT